jgi:hypothetical protein
MTLSAHSVVFVSDHALRNLMAIWLDTPLKGKPSETILTTIRPMEDRFASFRNATAAALLRGSGATPHNLREAIASGSAPPEARPREFLPQGEGALVVKSKS